MKKRFHRSALLAAGLLSMVLLPAAQAGTADGDGSVIAGGINTGIPTPHFTLGLDVQEGYNDNVLTSRNTQKTASGFTQAQLNVFANMSSPRTVFTIGLGGGLTYYYNRPGDKTDKLANLSINLVHKVNERLTLTFNSYNTYQVQPQFDLLVEQNRVNGQYFYTAESDSAAYQWTRRFSTVTGYSVTGIFYEDQAAKKANDYVQQTFSNQFRFQALPTTTLVAEYRFGLVNYLHNPQGNIVTNYGLLGFDHTFSPKFTVSLRAGGQIQNQSAGNTTSTSPYAELTSNYQYQRYSSINTYLNYGFQYSNLAISQTNKALRLGISVNHGITSKLSAAIGFFYEHDDFSQTVAVNGYTDDTLNINLGLNFAISKRLTLRAGYQHTSLLSSDSTQEYDQNVFTLGGTFSF